MTVDPLVSYTDLKLEEPTSAYTSHLSSTFSSILIDMFFYILFCTFTLNLDIKLALHNVEYSQGLGLFTLWSPLNV